VRGIGIRELEIGRGRLGELPVMLFGKCDSLGSASTDVEEEEDGGECKEEEGKEEEKNDLASEGIGE